MKKGFTVAEVLITLGVIGIVAAMTMPTLIANHQKEVVATSLRKAYAELNLALQMAISDYGDVSTWDYSTASEIAMWAENYIQPYFKVLRAQNCSNNRTYSCIGVPMAEKIGGDYRPYGIFAPPYVIVPSGGAIKALAFYKYNYYSEVRVHVYIKIPQKMKAKKERDVFTFVLKPNKTAFEPFGLNYSRDTLLKGPIRAGGCFKESGGPDYYGAGDACAAVIMMDGWKIKPDYPW